MPPPRSFLPPPPSTHSDPSAGFHEADIGTALSLSGLSAVGFQLLLFPPLQRRAGTVPLYRALMSLWPFVFALFPVMSWCARERGRDAVWSVLVVFLLLKSVCVLFLFSI